MPALVTLTTNHTAAHVSKDLHGGKGYGLIRMADAGLPVPEAAIFTTAAWHDYRATGKLSHVVTSAVHDLCETYPDAMFSVRSGAPISMPGMMDTILNVGVDPAEEVYPGSFRRFATGWLEIVHGVQKDRIDLLMKLATERAKEGLSEMAVPHKSAVNRLIAGVIQRAEGKAIPASRAQQILNCIEAVFNSWDTPRARAYRKMHDIAEDMGTACVVQRMVMGTAPGLSGSGVMFSRNPATGDNRLTGEIAFNAQGEEVVSGAVTPMNIAELENGTPAEQELSGQLVSLAIKLEQYFGDVQDIEFTVENGSLYVLQTRTAKMSARARIVTACYLSSKLDRDARLPWLRERVTQSMVSATMTPSVVTSQAPLATGLAASPGAVSGQIVFRSTPLHMIDKTCILVADDTAPEDFPQMAAAGAILTATGGFTCHSAVVARGIGVPAVVGSEGVCVDGLKNQVTIGGLSFSAGSWITIDGTTGKVWAGAQDVNAAQPPREIFETLALYADPDKWYLNTAFGHKVALDLPVSDLARCEAQIARASRLRAKGKTVGYVIVAPGAGEDVFGGDVMSDLAPLYDNFAGDLDGSRTLVTMADQVAIAEKLGMVATFEPVHNLLDLLEEGGPC